MTHDPQKEQVRERFSQFADAYVHSAGHAKGAELDQLLALAAPEPGWLALDIATGGGHTALRFASHVRRVVATDFAVPMLRAARAFIGDRAPVTYAATDAERLAFRAGTFDLVMCRIAPHHFGDPFAFVCECARVLKAGGLLLVQDHLHPEDDRAARYIDSFQRLRDPGHVRGFAEYEWRGMFLDAGLAVEAAVDVAKRTALIPWAQRQGCPDAVIERLRILLAQAPQAAAAWLEPQCIESADASFVQRHILIAGRKPIN